MLFLPFLLVGCFRTRDDIAKEEEDKNVRVNLQQNLGEVNQHIEHLQTDVSALHGKVEEIEFQRKKETGQQHSNREVLEKNLHEHSEKLEKNITAIQDRIDQLQKNQDSLFEELKKIREENTILLKQSQDPVGKPSVGGSATKKGSLQKGLAEFKKKEYLAAISEIQAYLNSYPNGKKRIEAHFYLGESFFREKEYQKAILEFENVHEKSADSSLGRKATLRIAESFKALGKTKDAKAFAQLVIDNFPDSAEAKIARRLLK